MKPEQDIGSTESTVSELGYVPALDGLRGISILAVMAFNGNLLGLQGGFVGVDIFFVLSGFLITALLFQDYNRTGSIGIRNFYFRRALRLLPALLLLIAACVAFALLVNPDRSVIKLKGVLYTLFYVANWAQVPPMPPGLGFLSHTWSLSVEEQFYIIWPLLLLGLLKLKNKGVVLAILLSLIGLSVASSVWLWQSQVPYLRMYFGSDTRAHELLIGCVAALLLSWGAFHHSPSLKRAFHIGAAISVAGILSSFFLVRPDTAFVYNGGFTLICIGTAVLILDLLLFPSLLSRIFEFAPLVWIGKISYGLYLWHFPVFEASNRLFEGSTDPMVYLVAGVAFTVLIAALSFYWLEQPLLKLRRRPATNIANPLMSPAVP